MLTGNIFWGSLQMFSVKCDGGVVATSFKKDDKVTNHFYARTHARTHKTHTKHTHTHTHTHTYTHAYIHTCSILGHEAEQD
jgi:hypothetical protein